MYTTVKGDLISLSFFSKPLAEFNYALGKIAKVFLLELISIFFADIGLIGVHLKNAHTITMQFLYPRGKGTLKAP